MPTEYYNASDELMRTTPKIHADFYDYEYKAVIDNAGDITEVINENFIDPSVTPVPDYEELRQKEYPAYEDYLDAKFHQLNGDSTFMDAWFAKCLAVKAKYPKYTPPEQEPEV
jgi:hypothetical protein